ncbi:retrotransposon protein, putative, ty1-copia subclass [Tanacetum coccineum]
MAGNTVKDMTTNFGKLDKFEGHDFRRWQKKMHFLLTTLKVVYVLTTPMPELLEDATVEAIRRRAKWENDDYICRGHILNGMSDSLFDVYTNVESAKELWDSLESKYMAEDSSSKKFLSISVSSIIDKLPPSWKDYKHTLKHGKDNLSLVQLGSHFHIKESLRAQESNKGKGKEVAGPSGCEALVKRDTLTKPEKLEPRSIKCIFIGYPKETMGYSFYYPPENKVLVARNAEFLENSLITQEARDLGKPANYKAALLDPKSDEWLNAMNVEMQSMKDNEVWDLVDLPPNGKTVGSKWLFKKKTRMDGAVHTYKLRVCKLKRSIYGLKQASRPWNKRFDDEIKKFGFTQNRDEPCVYLKASKSNVTFLILYVDDILVMGNNILMLQDVKSYLGRCFAMKDLGEAAYILGIKIYRDRSRWLIGLCQSSYIEKILKRYNMENSKRGSIPMQDKLRLSKSQGASTPAELKRMQNVSYTSAVGSIMVSCYTDVGYVGTEFADDLVHYLHEVIEYDDIKLEKVHTYDNLVDPFTKALAFLKHSEHTRNIGMLPARMHIGHPNLREGYSDASWINHVEDSSSTSGWVFLLGGGAISWASKKQTCITSSTMESEFVALAAAGKEAEWLRNLIHEIPIWPKPIAPISIRCDSAPTMARAYSQIYNGKSRHLGVRHSMVRELIRNGVISIEFVRTQHNLADHLTKGLARDLLEIGTHVSSSRGARSKGTTYVNMKFSRFKKLGLSFLYVHQWIRTHGL